MQQTSKDSETEKLFLIKKPAFGVKEYLEEAEFLKKERATAESLKIPIVDDETGRFLELACRLLKPSKILEIGCGTGYSTYFLLKSLLPELKADNSEYVMCKADKSPVGTVKVVQEPGDCKYKTVESSEYRDKTQELAGSKSAKTISRADKKQEPAGIMQNNPKKQFGYTGIDLNRERLGRACSFIGGLINKTIMPCLNGERIKNVIESENLCCSFEFIHGNAVKIIQESNDMNEKYDLVFIDAAKYQYPCYLEAVKDRLKNGCAVIADNIFYNGKIFLDETVKHDANSVAGLTEYLRMVTGQGAFETSLFNTGDGIALSIYNKNKY